MIHTNEHRRKETMYKDIVAAQRKNNKNIVEKESDP